MTDQVGAARRLLSFAKTEFGEHLSELLLSGYGVARVVLRWRYTVSLQDDGSREITVEGVTDDPKGLPAGREPLVLLTLLKSLLAGGRPSNGQVSYGLREVLKTLSWNVGEESAVERAIEGYYQLSLIKHEIAEMDAGEGSINRKRVLRPIVEWERGEETAGGDRLVVPKGGRVRFNPEFVEGLTERSLLGIDWERVSSVAYSV